VGQLKAIQLHLGIPTPDANKPVSLR
jgi:hypothetical protein